MGFKGDLSTISLADLFQTLSATGKQGTLHVQDGESVKAIYFSPEGVHLLSSGRRKLQRLGDILVAAGRITPAQLETALALQKETNARLGEVLINLKLITQGEIEKYVRGQIEEEIYDLFTWKEARFEFAEGAPSRELTTIENRPTSLTFDVQGLLLEAARRLDEWTQIERAIPTARKVLVPTGTGDAQSVDASSRAVLSHIDGASSIADVENSTLSSRFVICKSVAKLLDAGLVRVMDAEETRGELRKAFEAGNLARAVRLGRNLVASEPGDLEALQQLAASLRTMGQPLEAAQEYRRLGERCLAEKNAEMAASAFGFAVECAPEDHELARAQVDALGQAGRTADVIAQGSRLVGALLSEGHTPEAVEVARSLVTLAPRESAAHLLLADALLGARKKEDALAALLSARAQLPVTEVDQHALFDKRIAQIDPTRVFAPRDATRKPSPPRRRGRIVLVLVALLMAAAGIVWLLDERAKKDLAAARDKARQLMEEKKWDEAVAELEAVRSGYPISFIGGDVANEIAEVRAAQKRGSIGPVSPALSPADANALADGRDAAEALEKKGEYEDAARAWKDLAELASKLHADDVAATANEGVARANGSAHDSVDLLDRAGKAEDGKDYKEACRLVSRLRADYPESPSARKSAYPVHVTTVPSNAEVFLDEKSVGRTPIVLHLVPDQQKEVKLALPGCPMVIQKVADLLGGELHWTFERLARWWVPSGAPIEATPILCDGAILCATREGSLFSLDPDTHAEKWRVVLPEKGAVSRSPARAQGLLIVVSEDKRVCAIQPGEAKPRWSVDLSAPVRGAALPMAEAGKVVLAAGDGAVSCYPLAGGEALWKVTLGATISATPVGWKGTPLVATEGGSLIALSLGSGDAEWSVTGLPPIWGSMALDGDRLLAAGGDGRVVAIDLAARKVAWTRALESGAPGGLSFIEGRVLLGLPNGKVVCLTPSGEVLWTFATGGPVDAPPAAKGATVYAASEDGSVYAIDAAKGMLTWKYEVGAKVRSGILLGSGLLYFGADNSRVFALEP